MRLGPAALLALLALTAPVVSIGAPGQTVRGSRRPVVLVYAKAVAGSPSAPAWIWRARPDGSHPVRLRRGRAPVVSPDGRTIAFTRTRLVTSGGATTALATLWLMRSDGSRARPIMRTRGGFGPIAWSPDSSRLLAGASDGLRLIVRAQGTARLLRGTEPSESSAVEQASSAPDSGSMVSARLDATGADVFTLSLAGGPPAQLTHDHKSFAPLWGSSKIAYQRGFIHGDIWLMGGDGAQKVRLSYRCRLLPGRLVGGRPAPARGEPRPAQRPSVGGRGDHRPGEAVDPVGRRPVRAGTLPRRTARLRCDRLRRHRLRVRLARNDPPLRRQAEDHRAWAVPGQLVGVAGLCSLHPSWPRCSSSTTRRDRHPGSSRSRTSCVPPDTWFTRPTSTTGTPSTRSTTVSGTRERSASTRSSTGAWTRRRACRPSLSTPGSPWVLCRRRSSRRRGRAPRERSCSPPRPRRRSSAACGRRASASRST